MMIASSAVSGNYAQEAHILGVLMRRPDLLYRVDRSLQEMGLSRLAATHHLPLEALQQAAAAIPIIEPGTGAIHEASLFVAAWGASNYTYAEATRSQQLADWLGSHVRAFEYFGGVPQILVPDNPKTGVTRADRYEPEINRSYQELAEHYGTVVIPARPYKPRDKAKVEAAVLVAERWILARLRHRQFFALEELNGAIAELLGDLNARPFAKLPGDRRSAFAQLDAPAMRPLPRTPYVFAQWKRAKVGVDYHCEVDATSPRFQ